MSGDHAGASRTDCAPDYSRTRKNGRTDGTHIDLSHGEAGLGRALTVTFVAAVLSAGAVFYGLVYLLDFQEMPRSVRRAP
ncbi:hypothetical protein ACIP25_07510 [Streptomyces massasporeus]|uniref:hypothetical protein n=1 Tax=Streptomyces massasporeus TaxID=67324 RepID=UPI0038275D99